MSTQLDILALEPFYGGVRKTMLETVIRHSRHRWTVLKLPPRRIERRLTAAATWFAEQLTRHWVGSVDLLVTSEALNLANFHRLMPNLARKPSVVYFHANQLPPADNADDNALHLVNLNTAQAATEIWFNSLFHLRDFLHRASAMVARHPELSSRNPMPDITAKARLMPPPIDTGMSSDHGISGGIRRGKRVVFVDTRDADVRLINAAFGTLTRRAEKWQFITVGPVEELAADLPRRTVSERDEQAQAAAMHECAVMISTKMDATSDYYAVRGLAAGCTPVWPHSGVYPELLPEALHPHCLYDGTAIKLASQMQDIYHVERPGGTEHEQRQILKAFDPVSASHAMDQRLEALALSGLLGR